MNRGGKFPDRPLLLLLGVLALAVWVIWRTFPSLLASAKMSTKIAAIMWISVPPPMSGEMKAMCENDGGTRIYERVANVGGYAILPGEDQPTIEQIASGKVSGASIAGGCFPCFEELIKNRYAFVETYYVSPRERVRGGSYQVDFYAARTGLYRYRLVRRIDSPDLCEPFDRVRDRIEGLKVDGRRNVPPLNLLRSEFLTFDRQYSEFESELDGLCVYAQPINAFSARYATRFTRRLVGHGRWRGAPTEIWKNRSYVGSVDGKHVMAESVRYNLFSPKTIVQRKSCGSDSLPHITKILQP